MATGAISTFFVWEQEEEEGESEGRDKKWGEREKQPFFSFSLFVQSKEEQSVAAGHHKKDEKSGEKM